MVERAMNDDVEIYSEGLLSMSVCSKLSPEETVARVNQINPSGTENGWQISSDKTFRQGASNPCVCEVDPDRKHYLLNC
jgi:hypothetical protein